ncbi:fg-gap repeat family protein [Colletotrichum truncatum]|uniref:Fg-gap repeat family protein n=1 Tax=Colletotrichum truncatum TaxID=5467 RepID=A0ACC3ZB09_COLTU|nr:fg-gap repeat family protein [Colletotrichum truncatum]KAF6783190.1 fg-gap repeat family protein [Colletotrichum truncatum]
MRFLAISSAVLGFLGGVLVEAARPLENLGRGIVAVRSSEQDILVSWRLLGLDPKGIGFNIYRDTGSSPTKLNTEVLTGGTNFLDSTADLNEVNTYFVRPVVDGNEQDASSSFSLPASTPIEPIVRVPIRSGGPVKFIWVGDLDGDGEWDYVLDRQTSPQSLEAYTSNGTFLWEVNLGPNSENQNNIEPGSSAIDVGHWDGVTVFDFDSDGRAEVAVRIANGVVFGDGVTFNEGETNEHQYLAILDGRTGALRASSQVPTDYIEDGPLAARLGAGFLDGETPHLVAYMKNRIGSGDFNLMFTAWTFDGNALKQEWKWTRGNGNYPDGHNTRIIDVNGDGKDEVLEIGFVLNGDGTPRYSLGDQGVVHGDRFHVAKIDPTRNGLQGFGVQQRNPEFLYEYYYDADTGNILWKHYGESESDIGRGMVGDIDPTHEGMEVWSFSGVYNGKEDELTEPDTGLAPWPHLGLWWDGDELLELFNDGKFEKWDWENPSASNSLPRILRVSDFGGVLAGRNPQFLGDILGDWREEVIVTNESADELLIFTTDKPSDIRLYTLAHNPAYRNSMTLKGYVQSHHVDYFLGKGMETPPQPNIRYAGV